MNTELFSLQIQRGHYVLCSLPRRQAQSGTVQEPDHAQGLQYQWQDQPWRHPSAHAHAPLLESKFSFSLKRKRLRTDIKCSRSAQLAFQKFEQHSTRTSSYNLRPLLWEAGSTVSNKVLECLVLRFARRQLISAEGFVMAMVRLHLAHGQ